MYDICMYYSYIHAVTHLKHHVDIHFCATFPTVADVYRFLFVNTIKIQGPRFSLIFGANSGFRPRPRSYHSEAAVDRFESIPFALEPSAALLSPDLPFVTCENKQLHDVLPGGNATFHEKSNQTSTQVLTRQSIRFNQGIHLILTRFNYDFQSGFNQL